MGRPERAVDPEAGPVERFAHDLRRLRRDAGLPTYRELACKSHYSASVLSRAASGRDLPSLAVTLAYVGACGGDITQWQARWQALAHQLQPSIAPPSADVSAEQPGTAGLRLQRVAMAGAGLAVAAALVAGGWLMAGTNYPRLAPAGEPSLAAPAEPGQVPTGNPAPAAPPVLAGLHDGADPADVGCFPGAVTIAVEQLRATPKGRSSARGALLGMLELQYSARCRAEWAQVIPVSAFDYPVAGKEVIGVSRPGDGTKTSYQLVHIEEAYSDMLVTSGGCVSAYAVLMIADGQRAEASTPCRRSQVS